jgi:hypothetical protein
MSLSERLLILPLALGEAEIYPFSVQLVFFIDAVDKFL